MKGSPRKKRLLVFIVAYNAARTIKEVVSRLPLSLAEYDTEILIIDDSSRDSTFEQAYDIERTGQASALGRNDPTLLAKSDPAPPGSGCRFWCATRTIMPVGEHQCRESD